MAIRVSIKNKRGVETHAQVFDSQEEVDAYVEKEKVLNSWGHLERWLDDDAIKNAGLNIIDATEVKEVEVNGVVDKVYKFEQEFSISYEDVTLQVKEQKKIQEGLKKQSFGNYLIAKVYALNEAKAEAMSFDLQTIEAVLNDPALAKVERLLKNGSISFARAAINSLDNSFYTEAEKIEFIAEIDKFLLSLK